MGPSGCGKTTFMNALLGRAHYAHTSGEVLINNAECRPVQHYLILGNFASALPDSNLIYAAC